MPPPRTATADRKDPKDRTPALEAESSSSDQVVDYITRNILAGRYVPGQRLIEADLTRAVSISRGPVREAYRRLDALGILTRTMHRGACVRTFSRTEAADLLLAMEPLAELLARLAAERFSKPVPGFDSTPFSRELRPFIDRIEDAGNLLRQRRHFYDLLVAISGNSALSSLIPTMRIHLLRTQVQSFLDPDNRIQHVEDYATIAEAVVNGKARAAMECMGSHIKGMRAVIGELPDAAFPRSNDD